MKTEFRIAGKDDFSSVKDLYYKLIDDMDGLEYAPKWEKNIYPSEADFKEAIEKGELHLLFLDGILSGAVRLNESCAEGYESLAWKSEGKVLFVHILCIAAKSQRKGLGKVMVSYIKEYAEKEGYSSVRLDVIDGNYPANRLYEGQGFAFIDEVTLYYEDTGYTDFQVYEYVI